MKTMSLIIISMFLFSIGAGASAQETDLPDPGLTPDSPFYFLERVVEEIGTFFTFGDLKKAERYATLAAERLAEAQVMAEKGRTGLVERTLEMYEAQLQNSMVRAEKAQAKGENTEEVMTKVSQATSKHLEVLAEVYERVAEEDKGIIENAMKVSVKGHEKAVEALKVQNALGEVPEEVPMPTQIPQEVKERVQMRAQQELEIEKAFESIDASKSARDICQDQGVAPEICEVLPSKKFESFREIEAFCLEQEGVTPEICSSLESKCREFGVTTPNECFIFLSVYSISTIQSVEMKVVPAPTLPEGTIQQQRIPVESEEQTTETEKRLKQRYVPGESKAIIYSTPNCPHCVSAMQWFQQHNIEYEVFDISQDETKQDELMEKAGQLVVPIIEVEDDIIVGFDEERFSELFGVE
jgi:glutaredoxin